MFLPTWSGGSSVKNDHPSFVRKKKNIFYFVVIYLGEAGKQDKEGGVYMAASSDW